MERDPSVGAQQCSCRHPPIHMHVRTHSAGIISTQDKPAGVQSSHTTLHGVQAYTAVPGEGLGTACKLRRRRQAVKTLLPAVCAPGEGLDATRTHSEALHYSTSAAHKTTFRPLANLAGCPLAEASTMYSKPQWCARPWRWGERACQGLRIPHESSSRDSTCRTPTHCRPWHGSSPRPSTAHHLLGEA